MPSRLWLWWSRSQGAYEYAASRLLFKPKVAHARPLPGEERRGSPEKLSQLRESVGEGPEASIQILVGWLKAGPFCSDVVEDAIVAGFASGQAQNTLQIVVYGTWLQQSIYKTNYQGCLVSTMYLRIRPFIAHVVWSWEDTKPVGTTPRDKSTML
jgi:hypothetical protein